MTPAPFLKWAGGKRKLAAHIASRAPMTFGAYHEPFLGGGAVFFRLRADGSGSPARLSDANAELVNCYEVVRDRTGELIAALCELGATHFEADADGRREHYYTVRGCSPSDPVARAARLIFLNRTGYNGLYRVNRDGRFNVPFGRYARPRIADEPGLWAAAEALRNTTLHAGSFEGVCAAARAGDFVYFDPPYVPLSATASFTQYTGTGFGPGEQARLRDCFEELSRAGVACLLSNSDHEVVRTFYGGRGYAYEVVAMSRAINSAGTKRSPIAELLIDNFDRPEVRATFGTIEAEANSLRRPL